MECQNIKKHKLSLTAVLSLTKAMERESKKFSKPRESTTLSSGIVRLLVHPQVKWCLKGGYDTAIVNEAEDSTSDGLLNNVFKRNRQIEPQQFLGHYD